MTLQKITCTNIGEHAIKMRSSLYAIRSIQYSSQAKLAEQTFKNVCLKCLNIWKIFIKYIFYICMYTSYYFVS